LILAGFAILSVLIAAGGYRLARRWGSRTEMALAALTPFALATVVFTLAEPRLALAPLWPSLIASLTWLTCIVGTRRWKFAIHLSAWIAAGMFMLIWPAIFLTNYLSSGPNDLPLLAALWGLVVFVVLPAIEGAAESMRIAHRQ
jgi:hypothetical protein